MFAYLQLYLRKDSPFVCIEGVLQYILSLCLLMCVKHGEMNCKLMALLYVVHILSMYAWSCVEQGEADLALALLYVLYSLLTL